MDPGEEYEFGSQRQKEEEEAAIVVEDFPVGHTVHASPSSEFFPAGQSTPELKEVGPIKPTTVLDFPAAQEVHIDIPVTSAYLPTAQGLQTFDSGPEEKVPRGQGVQAEEPKVGA